MNFSGPPQPISQDVCLTIQQTSINKKFRKSICERVCRSVVYGRRQHHFEETLYFPWRWIRNSETPKFSIWQDCSNYLWNFQDGDRSQAKICPWSKCSLHSMLSHLNQSVNNICHPTFCPEPMKICHITLEHPNFEAVHFEVIKLSFGPLTTGDLPVSSLLPAGGDSWTLTVPCCETVLPAWPPLEEFCPFDGWRFARSFGFARTASKTQSPPMRWSSIYFLNAKQHWFASLSCIIIIFFAF